MSGPARFDTPCRVEIEHSEEFLCAHVELAGDVKMQPGDRVRVHGPGFDVPFGQRRVFERIATVQRAGWLARVWTRVAGHFAMTELYEVSFNPGSVR